MRHSFIEALLPQPRHNRLFSYQHSALPIDPPPTTLQGISVILPFNQTIPLYWGWWKSSVIIQCKQLLAQIVIVSCYKLRLISLYVWVMILKRDGKWQITSLWLTECQIFFYRLFIVTYFYGLFLLTGNPICTTIGGFCFYPKDCDSKFVVDLPAWWVGDQRRDDAKAPTHSSLARLRNRIRFWTQTRLMASYRACRWGSLLIVESTSLHSLRRVVRHFGGGRSGGDGDAHAIFSIKSLSDRR